VQSFLISWVNFDLVQIGTALELYRLQVGGYPEKLQDLHPGYVKRVPRNPFDGSPYQYQSTVGGSYVINAGNVSRSAGDLEQVFKFPNGS
jgi:hypothetical protein